jgi:hypothetical protein
MLPDHGQQFDIRIEEQRIETETNGSRVPGVCAARRARQHRTRQDGERAATGSRQHDKLARSQARDAS